MIFVVMMMIIIITMTIAAAVIFRSIMHLMKFNLRGKINEIFNLVNLSSFQILQLKVKH